MAGIFFMVCLQCLNYFLSLHPYISMAGIFFMVCLQCLNYFLSYAYEWVFGLDVGTAGLMMAIGPIGMAATAIIIGKVMEKVAARPILMGGMLLTALSALPIAGSVMPLMSLGWSLVFVFCCSAPLGLIGASFIPGIGYSENDRGKKYTDESRIETVTLDSTAAIEGSSLLGDASEGSPLDGRKRTVMMHGEHEEIESDSGEV
ncbi:hypothetical protein KIPB_007253, partial [Kipferlia bialata]|eukprot:g7253.t1